ITSGIDQECTQDGIYPANHLQVILAFAPVPHPTRWPNQTEGIYEKEDYAEYNERGFEKRLAGIVAHLDCPQPSMEEPSFYLCVATWQSSNLAPAQSPLLSSSADPHRKTSTIVAVCQLQKPALLAYFLAAATLIDRPPRNPAPRSTPASRRHFAEAGACGGPVVRKEGALRRLARQTAKIRSGYTSAHRDVLS